MTDGILLAELSRRQDAAPVRHADHRRGPRAQPQHRLHPRLPESAAAAPSRPQGRHHLGHDRPRAVRRALRAGDWARRCRSSRCPAGATPSRSGTGRSSTWTIRTTIPTATSSTPSATPWPSSSARGHGDILVFLPGEREIRDTAEALGKRDFRNTEILPLYARLSTAEQQRVFAPHPGGRVVLATNVAETSLTVPGIRYVVDTGTARISRYSRRLKVQRLPDREGLAGQREPARRPLRPRRRRHLHPALQRGRLRRAPRVHRSGDPAHQPRLGRSCR